MRFFRTFHPIGQGGFYSESHISDGKEFNIVYDCGSSTIESKDFENRIKESFPKLHQIDVLFISHFHKDHINGIKFLSKYFPIKTVIIPFLSKEEQILLLIDCVLHKNYANLLLIQDPESFFGKDVQIIRIEPIEPLDDSYENIDIKNISSQISYPSGTRLISRSLGNWIFVPYNYKSDERREILEMELIKYSINLFDLDSIEKVLRNKRDIIKAYKVLKYDLNYSSLILFSGVKSSFYINSVSTQESVFKNINNSTIQSGCLYTGDINLNEKGIVKDIGIRLSDFIPFIGTLQIPHHGSIHSFSNSILYPQIKCGILSYGSNNKYGHPSNNVIRNLLINNITPYLITELQSSVVLQWG